MPRSFYDFILSCFYQTGAPSFLQLAFSPFLSLSFACLSVIFRPSLASLCVPVLLYGWHVDISISLLAVVVGFCGLALLVVSLFVFWKLCWPIWRSKALPTHVENGLHVGFPDMPPTASPPVTECKVAEVEKKYPLEMKVNGRSTVKLLEAAMKISQTSPDIPAEVQTALREKLSQQAKIQRQTTEPTSSSRYLTSTRRSPIPSPLRRQNSGDRLIPPPPHTHAYNEGTMAAFLNPQTHKPKPTGPDSSWQRGHCPWGGLARVRDWLVTLKRRCTCCIVPFLTRKKPPCSPQPPVGSSVYVSTLQFQPCNRLYVWFKLLW